MKKTKKHYNVYYIGTGNGCYTENYSKTFLGDVWAVSEEQACNYVRYRYRDKERPNGGYSIDILGDRLDEGMVVFKYIAEEI